MLRALFGLSFLLYSTLLIGVEKHSAFEQSTINYLNNGDSRLVAKYKSGKITLKLLQLTKEAKKLTSCSIEVYEDDIYSYTSYDVHHSKADVSRDCSQTRYKGRFRYVPRGVKYTTPRIIEKELGDSRLNEKELACLSLQAKELNLALSLEPIKSFLSDSRVSEVKIVLVTDRLGLKEPKDLPWGIRIFSDPVLEVRAAVDSAGNCLHMSSQEILKDIEGFSQDKEVKTAIELERSRSTLTDTLKGIEERLKK